MEAACGRTFPAGSRDGRLTISLSPRPLSGPRISVIVPFHNVERYIKVCVDGLRAQSYPRDRFEIILVDNNSTDRSAEIAAQYCDVTLLRQSEPGSYAARNMGIRAAHGEIIVTIDPDCRPDEDWLEQVDTSMQDEGCLILLGHQRHANDSSGLALLEMYESEKIAYVTERHEPQLYFGYTSNMAFRRSLFDQLGLFPERVRGGDTVFVRQAVDKLGCDIVRYNPNMHTTHLELDSLRAYYNKRLIYGWSNDRLGEAVPFRPLQNSERWMVFKRLAGKANFHAGKKLAILSLLIPGVVLYEMGRRSGLLRRDKS